MLFCFCVLWNFVLEEEKTTRGYFSKFGVDFKTTNDELRLIQNGIERIRNEIGEIKSLYKPQKVVKVKKRAKNLPKWIELFAAPHWSEFNRWRGVFVFFVSYRYTYLRKCLESIAVASEDIDKSSVCVFALDRTPVTTEREVNETLKVIRNVSFCKVVVWKVEKKARNVSEKNYALRLKRHWWFVLENVFNATVTGMNCNKMVISYSDVY